MKTMTVIENKVSRGTGQELDPYRVIAQYYNLSGEFLAEGDPSLTIQILKLKERVKRTLQDEAVINRLKEENEKLKEKLTYNYDEALVKKIDIENINLIQKQSDKIIELENKNKNLTNFIQTQESCVQVSSQKQLDKIIKLEKENEELKITLEEPSSPLLEGQLPRTMKEYEKVLGERTIALFESEGLITKLQRDIHTIQRSAKLNAQEKEELKTKIENLEEHHNGS